MTNREIIKTYCLNSASNLCKKISIQIESENELKIFLKFIDIIEQLTRIAKMVDEISKEGEEE